MNTQTVSVAVAAGAAPVNVVPSTLQNVPNDGFLAILGVTDPATGLTGLPTLEVKVGLDLTPMATSPIPLNDINVALAGPNKRNILLPPMAVRQNQTLIASLGGGVGATATVRLQFIFAAAAESAMLAAALQG
ncbi:MAG: hypothetical protein M1582_05165 [Actinobacteria bacterium]|jgi:hypothetical protein|nr:hypothetical protein [Actinomycetota bacterium]